MRDQMRLVNSEEFKQFMLSRSAGQNGILPLFCAPVIQGNGAPSFGSAQFRNQHEENSLSEIEFQKSD
jgi:hypothetical protein